MIFTESRMSTMGSTPTSVPGYTFAESSARSFRLGEGIRKAFQSECGDERSVYSTCLLSFS